MRALLSYRVATARCWRATTSDNPSNKPEDHHLQLEYQVPARFPGRRGSSNSTILTAWPGSVRNRETARSRIGSGGAEAVEGDRRHRVGEVGAADVAVRAVPLDQ